MTTSGAGPAEVNITAEIPVGWTTAEHVGPFTLVATTAPEQDFAENLTVAVVP